MEELVYTSAPQGLRGGTGGFCTVEMTEGMSLDLCDALESLSAYDHDPAGTINWMHVRVPSRDGPRQVFSRVSPLAGDYSGRSNMLAHHICVGADEASPPLTPTALLGPGGPLRETWSGQVQQLSPQPFPAQTFEPHSAKMCSHWKKSAGDSGAAGGVLTRLQHAGADPIWLIRTPAMDALAMTLELLSLLPPSRQWEITFSTYLHTLPRSVRCRLRWVLADSPAHQTVRHLDSDRLIDLRQGSDALLATAQPALVAAARNGSVIDIESTSSHAPDIFVSGPMVDVGRAAPEAGEPTSGSPLLDISITTDASRRKSTAAWWTIGAVAIIIICLGAILMTVLVD